MFKTSKGITIFGIAAVVATTALMAFTVSNFTENTIPSLFHDPTLNNYYNHSPESKSPEESNNAITETSEISKKTSETSKNPDTSKPSEEKTSKPVESKIEAETETEITTEESSQAETEKETSVDATSKDEHLSPTSNDTNNEVIYIPPKTDTTPAENTNYETYEESSYVDELTYEKSIPKKETPSMAYVINDDIDKAYAALYSYDYSMNNQLIIDSLIEIGKNNEMVLNTDLDAGCFHDGNIIPFGDPSIMSYKAAVTWTTDPSEIRNKSECAFSEIIKTYGDVKGKEFNVLIMDYIDYAMPAPKNIPQNCYAIVILYR